MINNKLKRAASLIRKKISELFINIENNYKKEFIISVTKVILSQDSSLAKIYISIYSISNENKNLLFKQICNSSSIYKNILAKQLRHQFRKFPNIYFKLDDSFEYIENIEKNLIIKNNSNFDLDLYLK
ncbi:MAG: ribosome-binding factor A [Candidatus Bostrichicola ureolyticus]|nr:MAG: ribosome-binding factor A [Candidatus Bostrichicola ureolyticus]